MSSDDVYASSLLFLQKMLVLCEETLHLQKFFFEKNDEQDWY